MKTYAMGSLAAMFHIAASHYVFVRLIVNETVFPEWQYIRKFDPVTTNNSTGDGLFGPYLDPIYNYTSLDLRCGRGAYKNGAGVETISVYPGDKVGFQVGLLGYETEHPVEVVGHPGPGSAWLYRAECPMSYCQGDGKWFKIAQVVARNPEERKKLPPQKKFDWALYAKHSWNFTIPEATVPGNYLLRIEHLYPSLGSTSVLNKGTQWYVSCAHVRILGNGRGTPGPLVDIPGVYVANQSNVFFDSQAEDFNITNYQPPFPPVWRG